MSIFFLLALGLHAQPAVADKKDDDHIDINPLMTLGEQLDEVETECKNRPLDRDCEERKEAIKNDIKKLRNICRKDGKNPKCEALATPERDVVSTVEFYCRRYPHAPRCVRRKEFAKRATKRALKYCQKNPDSKRCEPDGVREKPKVDVDEYCKVFPEKVKCQRYFEKKRREQPEEDPEISGF